jgi:hypothetical protein
MKKNEKVRQEAASLGAGRVIFKHCHRPNYIKGMITCDFAHAIHGQGKCALETLLFPISPMTLLMNDVGAIEVNF